MNGYLRPPVFWAMIALAFLLFLLCLGAGLVWQPFVLGVVIAASIVEWGIEQNWLDHWRATWMYWQIGWIDAELQNLHRQIAEAREFHEVAEANALQIYYFARVQARQRLREELADLRYELQGAVEGVDYPMI